MTTAIAGIAGALLGGFGQKSGSTTLVQRRDDASTAALAVTRDPKIARLALKNAREERAYALLTDPQVLGAITVIGGILLAANVPFHHDPKTNAALQGIAATSAVLMGLGRAGCGDLTTLSIAGGTGAILALSGQDTGSDNDAVKHGLLAGLGGFGILADWLT